jgi:YVTN family beta-propeller protein
MPSARRYLTVAAIVSWAALVTACGKPSTNSAPPYRIYVTNETAGSVTVIDEPSHKVAATVVLGKRPRGMQAGIDGRQLFVALSGSPIAPPGVDEGSLPPPDKAADGIGVLDTPALRLSRVLKGASNPEQLALGSNGRFYGALEDTKSLIVMDIGTGMVLANVPVGDEPEGVAVSPDGKLVYVTVEGDNVLVAVDPVTFAVIKRIPVGKRPRSVAFAKDGAHAYVTGENDASLTLIDVARQTVVQTVKVPGAGARPMGVAVSPDGKHVYVTTGRGGQLVAFDAATLAPQKSVAVGQRPWGVAVSPDGRLVYTANGPSDDISVVDAASMTVTTTIKSAGKPWGVIVAPRCCG